LVLVLDELDGTITGAGVVRSARGASRFLCPEIVDFVDRSYSIAVIALDPNAKDYFGKSDPFRFDFETSSTA